MGAGERLPAPQSGADPPPFKQLGGWISPLLRSGCPEIWEGFAVGPR